MKNNPVLRSLGHAAAVFLHVTILVLSVWRVAPAIENQVGLWGPIIGLTLFVLSAAVTGALVLGRPILLYLDGKKAEAVRFFGYTLGWLFVFLMALLVLSPWR